MVCCTEDLEIKHFVNLKPEHFEISEHLLSFSFTGYKCILTLKRYPRKVKRPQGRPKTTWMQTVRQDLASIGIEIDLSKAAHTLNILSELTQDRNNWRGIVKCVVQY